MRNRRLGGALVIMSPKANGSTLQRIAMWIIGLPRENRAAAIDLARKVFEETFQQASLKSRSAPSTY